MHFAQTPIATVTILQKKKDLVTSQFGPPHAPSPVEGMGSQMSMNLQERVEEHRAAVLLGLPMADIRRFSRLAGLGHMEQSALGEQVVFTYDELQRLCLLAAQSSK